MGSSNVRTDGTGQLIELAEYTPFGSTAFALSLEPSALSAFRFTGQRLDASTGLYFYNARYSDADLGRFLQPDSLVQAPSDPHTLNRYSYVRNNPVRYVDPSGNFFFAIIAVVMAAAKVAAVGAAVGAAVRAVSAAIQGENIGKGALHGAADGATFAVAGAASY